MLPILVFAAALAANGCDFTKFDDLADKAPATRLEAGNGKPLLGFAKLDDAPGGILLMASTEGGGSISQIRVDENGSTTTNKTASDDYVAPNKLNLDGYFVRSFAPIWKDADTGSTDSGPLAFVGSTAGTSGKIQLLDTDSWRQKTLVAEENVDEFGIALAPLRFSHPENIRDLLVGAQGRVFLIDGSAYPLFTHVPCNVDGGLASHIYSSLAAGQLGSAPTLAVVAAPAANFVTVMGNLEALAPLTTTSDCSAATYTQIEAPPGALQFGAALLVNDIEGDLDLDVLVGAPEEAGGGAVYLYDSAVGYTPEQATKITAPEGAALFGTSLALGSFDGSNPMLAVGAPGSKDGTGSVYLYKISHLTAVGSTSFTPFGVIEVDRSGDKLGMGLAGVPFKKGTTTHDLLIVGAKSSALVLWSNTTSEHKDYRSDAP
ncbi:MAG: hypothetical protein JRH20_12620 [Deltaproteobacteria bacterium]|nr:hypothetical protein [Deltaproteobacteria bacterium]